MKAIHDNSNIAVISDSIQAFKVGLYRMVNFTIRPNTNRIRIIDTKKLQNHIGVEISHAFLSS